MLQDEYEVELVRPAFTDYQKKILYSPARFTVTKGATKIGKTFPHLFWLFEKAHERAKPGANYWWIAPIFAQAKIAFNRMRRTAVLLGYKINETELYIQTGPYYDSRIWFKGADKPDSLYGEDVYAAVFDEFTRAKEEAWTALRSTLTFTKGPCKLIGNSKGRKNWGHRLWVKANGGEPGYEAFRVTAYDAVAAGLLDAEEIEQAKRDLPENAFRELYLAEDLEDQSNPFGMEYIRKRIYPLSLEQTVCFGVDLAKSVDWTVVTGLDQDGKVSFFERWQSDWGQTKRRIAQMTQGYPTLVDSTGVGDAIVEDLQRENPGIEGYVFSARSKQILMEGLAAAIQGAGVTILPGVMQEEVESFEFEYGRTGVKYSAPAGMHDDCVCSLALAKHCHSKNSFSGPYVQPRSMQ